MRARPCNDHRLIPTQEEEQVFHFSLAYRPTLTSSSSILRTSRLSDGRKKRRGEKEKTGYDRTNEVKNARRLRADVGPAGVETDVEKKRRKRENRRQGK